MMLAATTTPTRLEFDQQIEETRDDEPLDYIRGWFCIGTEPFPCPSDGCDFVAHFLTAAHLIVVWSAKDDRDLLQYANDARRLGRNPKVVEYQPTLGPCISFWAWMRAGHPVHGKLPRPDGIPFRSF